MLESFFNNLLVITCAVAVVVVLAVVRWLYKSWMRVSADPPPPPERGRGIYTGADRPVCSDCGASIDLGEPHGRGCAKVGA
jgi:hypothetical protein